MTKYLAKISLKNREQLHLFIGNCATKGAENSYNNKCRCAGSYIVVFFYADVNNAS